MCVCVCMQFMRQWLHWRACVKHLQYYLNLAQHCKVHLTTWTRAQKHILPTQLGTLHCHQHHHHSINRPASPHKSQQLHLSLSDSVALKKWSGKHSTSVFHCPANLCGNGQHKSYTSMKVKAFLQSCSHWSSETASSSPDKPHSANHQHFCLDGLRIHPSCSVVGAKVSE